MLEGITLWGVESRLVLVDGCGGDNALSSTRCLAGAAEELLFITEQVLLGISEPERSCFYVSYTIRKLLGDVLRVGRAYVAGLQAALIWNLQWRLDTLSRTTYNAHFHVLITGQVYGEKTWSQKYIH